MILTLLAILLILGIAYFQVTQGVFSALITAFASIVAAMIAFNYYEPIASALLYTRQPGLADAGMLLALFLVSMFAVLELFNLLLKDNVEMSVWTDRIGGGALGLVTGSVMVGVLVAAMQMMPVAGMMGYKPFVDNDKHSLLTREGKTNRVYADEAVVGLMGWLSGESFSGENSLDKIHDDLLLESFAAVNDSGASGRIDALPDALTVKFAKMAIKPNGTSWYNDVPLPSAPPNPDKDAKTQILVVRAHVDESAKDEDGFFVLPATQFRLVARSKQDPQQTKSYYPVGYLTYSTVDDKGWELWTAPQEDKNKPANPDEKPKPFGLTALLVARSAPSGGLYVDWVYRIDDGEVPAYMTFRRVAKATIPPLTEYNDQDKAHALDKNPLQFRKAPEPAKPVTLGLKAGSSIRPGSLQVRPKAGKAAFTEEFAKGSPAEATAHLLDLTAGKDMELGKTVPDAISCTISPDGKQAFVCTKAAAYLLTLDPMKAVKIADGEIAACWMGSRIILAERNAGDLGHMKVYNPADGKFEEWQLSGQPIASDAFASLLLAVVNPKAPKDVIAAGTLGACSIALVDGAGRINNKEIAPMATAAALPVASNSLKWIAFSSSPKGMAPKARGDKLSVTIIGVDSKVSTTVGEEAQPVGMTDAGLLVALYDASPDGSTIETYQNGKTLVLAKKAFAAVLADNKIYYVTGAGDKATLSSIDLP
jgi:uncharacterized membrane protein required for colicin V production